MNNVRYKSAIPQNSCRWLINKYRSEPLGEAFLRPAISKFMLPCETAGYYCSYHKLTAFLHVSTQSAMLERTGCAMEMWTLPSAEYHGQLGQNRFPVSRIFGNISRIIRRQDWKQIRYKLHNMMADPNLRNMGLKYGLIRRLVIFTRRKKISEKIQRMCTSDYTKLETNILEGVKCVLFNEWKNKWLQRETAIAFRNNEH
jgi:hypothetical protein